VPITPNAERNKQQEAKRANEALDEQLRHRYLFYTGYLCKSGPRSNPKNTKSHEDSKSGHDVPGIHLPQPSCHEVSAKELKNTPRNSEYGKVDQTGVVPQLFFREGAYERFGQAQANPVARKNEEDHGDDDRYIT
jgi:hypothetical protein